jgi:hypothetical protein
MARATFVKSAQKDIYHRGKQVSYVSKKGKREGETKYKLDRTIPADDKDTIMIAKGESYYWWQFKNSGKSFSKTAPKASQLTQSSFLSTYYSLQERISDINVSNKEDFDAEKEDILSEIESLKDQCQDSLDNMPESLQSSPTGELLQERIDGLDEWYSEIEQVECEDYDEEEIKKEIIEEYRDDLDEEDEEKETGEPGDLEDQVNDKIQAFVDDAISELQNCSCSL